MEVVRIGSDEIILWLRKNNKKMEVSNPLLFKDVHELLVKRLGGIMIQENEECIWPLNDEKKINDLYLPKTAPQYLIKAEKTAEMFIELNSWN